MPDFGLPLRERLGQYPRQPDLTIDALRTAARWIVVGLVKLQFPTEVRGSLPAGEEPVLIIH